MYANREELCNREYNSLYEARNAASGRGFTLGYSGLSIGANKSKQSSTGKWNISETDFCTSSKTDFETAYGADYNSEVASVAVTAWLDCVRSANENALFIDYEVSREGNTFSGILRTTASTGPLARAITGIAVVGDAKDSVRCNIGGTEYIPNEFTTVEVQTTGTAVACEKDGDLGAEIAFQTSAGATPFINLPSKVAIELAAWDELSSEFAAFKAAVEKKNSDVETVLDAAQSNMTSMEEHLARIARIPAATDIRLRASEEHQGYKGCPGGFTRVQTVCSGDCSSDDAKFSVCVKKASLQ
ncbi:MAG: hypothetical protein AAFY56_14080 [Pseudomonadota bacterium]